MAVSPSTMATLVAARDAAGAAYALAAKAYIDAYIELKAYDEVLSNSNVVCLDRNYVNANSGWVGPGHSGSGEWHARAGQGGPLPTFPSTLPETLLHNQYARARPYPNESYATKAAARRDQVLAPLDTSVA